MSTPGLPPKGALRDAYLAGARAESRLSIRGMSPESLELCDYVQTVARQGRTQRSIVRETAVAFTADWTFRERLSLAWGLLRFDHPIRKRR